MVHEEQSSPATSQSVPPEPVATVAVPFEHVHVLATHVCADPKAAAAEIINPALHTLQSSVAVSQSVAPDPVASVGVPLGQVQVLAMQVCADPDAAVADIVKPEEQTLQSTVAVSHNVPADPVARVGVPFGHVHVFAAHFNVLKAPFVPHVAVPLPVYPMLHVTVTVCVVVPVKRKEEKMKYR